MAKSKLTDEIRTYIVQCLACFDTPSAVAAQVKAEFKFEISRQAVQNYDPYKKQGTNGAEKWKPLFDATRAAFLEDTAQIGISHRAVRLRTLERLAQKAEDKGNMVLVASLLEQAAKEVGEAYTNKRMLEHTGPNGGPIQTESKTWRERLREEIQK